MVKISSLGETACRAGKGEEIQGNVGVAGYRRRRHPVRPRPTKRPMELLPASLLPYRQTWQPLIRALPTNTYLIVTDLNNPPQNTSLLRLVHSLRRQGQSVYLLSVG